MKVLVLGGNGFIGSHILDKLLAAGHKVRVYDRAPEHFRAPNPKVDYRVGGFEDQISIAEALVGIDVVVHCISTTVPSTSMLDPVGDIQQNLIGTVNLLSLMEAQKVKKIVYLSSGGTVYGIPDVSPIVEEHPLRPISPYGLVKVAIENYIYMRHKNNGLEYTILRISNPFGPRQGHGGVQGVIGTYLFKASQGEPLQVWGDGSVVRDFIYIEDLANLITMSATENIDGTFNAGVGYGLSIADIITKIKTDIAPDIEINYQESRGFDVPHVVLDNNKVSKALSWKPETDFDTGIEKTWEWMKEYNAQQPG